MAIFQQCSLLKTQMRYKILHLPPNYPAPPSRLTQKHFELCSFFLKLSLKPKTTLLKQQIFESLKYLNPNDAKTITTMTFSLTTLGFRLSVVFLMFH